MKQFLLINIVSYILLYSFKGLSQNSDSIFILSTCSGGLKFTQNNEKITPPQLFKILASEPDCKEEAKKAETHYYGFIIVSAASGFILGYSFGSLAGSGEPNIGPMLFGFGFALVSLPFSIGYKKQITNAINIYNSKI